MGELRGLRGRLLTLVLLASLSAVLLALGSAYQQRAYAADTALLLARQVALGQERQIERASVLLAGLGQPPNMIDLALADCSRALTTLHARYPLYDSLVAADPDGTVRCGAAASAPDASVAEHAAFKRAVALRGFAVSDFVGARPDRHALLEVARPVLDPAGRVERVLVLTLTTSWLGDLSLDADLRRGASLIVLDRSGTILAREPHDPSLVGRLPDGHHLRQFVGAPMPGTTAGVGVDGSARLFGYAPLEGPGRATGAAGPWPPCPRSSRQRLPRRRPRCRPLRRASRTRSRSGSCWWRTSRSTNGSRFGCWSGWATPPTSRRTASKRSRRSGAAPTRRS